MTEAAASRFDEILEPQATGTYDDGKPVFIRGPAGLWQILNYAPHSGQADLLQTIKLPRTDPSDPFYYIVESARRWGKTTVAEVLIWMALLQEGDRFGPPKVFVGADTYEHANKIWDRFERHLYRTPLRNLLARHDRERELVTLVTEATVQKFSGDRPESLTGDGYTFGIVDEGAFFSDEAMAQLYPAFTDRAGIIVAFGTAENDGTWFDIWGQRGDDPDYPEYVHKQYPWHSNPLVNPQLIQIARRDMTEEDFTRKYEARRPDSGGARFKNIEGCLTSELLVSPGFRPLVIQRAGEGREYVAGLDLASVDDFTVLTIADAATGRLVYFHRIGHGSFKAQAWEVARAVADYGARTLVDVTGVGRGVVEQLREALEAEYQRRWSQDRALPVVRAHFEEMTFTRQSKIEMEARLALLLEEEGLRFPKIDVLHRELQRYRGVLAPKASISRGVHDDTVSSLMLLAWILPRVPYGGVTKEFPREKGSWEE